MKHKKPILIVDDDTVDVMAIRRAMEEIDVTNRIDVSINGEAALEYLKCHNNERPCLILLDLNMPKMNGIEFLKKLKSDNDFKNIPIVVLTTSEEEQDRVDSFNLGVAGYIIKPVDYEEFIEIVKTINLYWTYSELT